MAFEKNSSQSWGGERKTQKDIKVLIRFSNGDGNGLLSEFSRCDQENENENENEEIDRYSSAFTVRD